MQSAGKPVTNLYLPSKEEGRIVKCYYAMVFYEKDDTIHKETLTTLSADDLCDFRDLCFTCKPSGDSPDHEERLVVLDCPATRDIDFSTMYPGLYPNGIALGYGLPPHFKQTIRDIYGAHFRMYETTFNWKANSISVALDRHGFGVSLNVFAISDKP
jgi:hypothetical protein